MLHTTRAGRGARMDAQSTPRGGASCPLPFARSAAAADGGAVAGSMSDESLRLLDAGAGVHGVPPLVWGDRKGGSGGVRLHGAEAGGVPLVARRSANFQSNAAESLRQSPRAALSPLAGIILSLHVSSAAARSPAEGGGARRSASTGSEGGGGGGGPVVALVEVIESTAGSRMITVRAEKSGPFKRGVLLPLDDSMQIDSAEPDISMIHMPPRTRQTPFIRRLGQGAWMASAVEGYSGRGKVSGSGAQAVGAGAEGAEASVGGVRLAPAAVRGAVGRPVMCGRGGATFFRYSAAGSIAAALLPRTVSDEPCGVGGTNVDDDDDGGPSSDPFSAPRKTATFSLHPPTPPSLDDHFAQSKSHARDTETRVDSAPFAAAPRAGAHRPTRARGRAVRGQARGRGRGATGRSGASERVSGAAAATARAAAVYASDRGGGGGGVSLRGAPSVAHLSFLSAADPDFVLAVHVGAPAGAADVHTGVDATTAAEKCADSRAWSAGNASVRAGGSADALSRPQRSTAYRAPMTAPSAALLPPVLTPIPHTLFRTRLPALKARLFGPDATNTISVSFVLRL